MRPWRRSKWSTCCDGSIAVEAEERATMSTPLLPQAFWFRLAIPCRRVEGLPRAGKGRLLALDASCSLPETATLDGKSSWADVRVAWNPGGLAIQVEAEKATAALIGK